ncbi:hypothetical protein CNMCM8980_005232 [Aspergillus fumigatiaffinis]|nr:hypothetical protein CNMCM8980_005232 [Aspergillus fumigatiaffinis]
MSDFNIQGRPIKRKRDSSCNRADPGNRDGDEEIKDPEPHGQQLPKSTAPATGSEPLAKEEKVHAIPPTTPVGSTAEPFRPLIRELQRLDDQNPVLAEQAARLVAVYRRLWESYVAKHADSSRLERENHQLQVAHSRLTDEKNHLQRHCREQEARSSHFQEAFRKVREGVVEIFEKWEDSKAEPATVDSAKGNKEKGSQADMAKSDTPRQGQVRGETDADDGQGLEAPPSHGQLEALDAKGCAQASAKTSDGHTMDQSLQSKRRRAGTACSRCHRRKIKCSGLPCRQCSLIEEICTPRSNAGSQKWRAIAQFSLINGGENDSYHAVESTVLCGTSVECTLPMSPQAHIVFPEERSRVIDYEYNNILPEANAEEARGQRVNPSTFINPWMSVDELNWWPFQDAPDSMLSATVPCFTETLEAPDWGGDWPWAQRLAQNDNGSALHQASPAPEQEVCSFPSEPEGSQSLGDTCAMFFWDEQPPVSESLTMRGHPEEQQEPSFPTPLTGLYPMSEFEWQDPTLEQPSESTDVRLPTNLSPTPMQRVTRQYKRRKNGTIATEITRGPLFEFSGSGEARPTNPEETLRVILDLREIITQQNNTIQKIAADLTEIKPDQQHLKSQNAELQEEVQTLRTKLTSLPGAGPTRSWAEVAVSEPPRGPNAGPRPRKRELNCVRISTRRTPADEEDGNDVFGRYLPTDMANAIIRSALLSADPTKDVQVAGIGTTKTGYVIRFRDTQSAEKAQNNTEWLHELGNDTKLVKPRFGVVVHRTPTEDFDLDPTA